MDYLLTGGTIRLSGGEPAEALAIGGGRVLAAGPRAELLRLRTSRTKVLDLAGQTVVAGLADSHLHLITTGQLLRQVDCGPIRTKDELLDAVRRRAEALPPDGWVVGRGWTEAVLAGGIPSRAELDAAASGRPVFLVRVCGHAALVSTAALAAGGMLEAWQPAPEVERDATGASKGLIHESAVAHVRSRIPAPTKADLAEALKAGMRLAVRAGLTQVHTEDMRYIGGRSVAFLLDLYRRVLREERYPLRVVHLFHHPHLQEARRLGLRTGGGTPYLRVGGIKCFADGAMGSRSALLTQPYADAPGSRGLAAMSPEELTAVHAEASATGLAVATHAIGDAAVDTAIRACVDGTLKATGDGIEARKLCRRLRHRLVHASYLRPEQFAAVRAAGMVVDIQPRFVYSDGPWMADRLGPERCRTAYAWKSLLDAGLRCGGGSDSPVESLNPLLGIGSAVTRRVREREAVFQPQERLSVAQALEAFTAGAAYVAHWERSLGAIRPGMVADLTILDQDPYSVDPDEIAAIRVTGTFVAGRPVQQQS